MVRSTTTVTIGRTRRTQRLLTNRSLCRPTNRDGAINRRQVRYLDHRDNVLLDHQRGSQRD